MNGLALLFSFGTGGSEDPGADCDHVSFHGRQILTGWSAGRRDLGNLNCVQSVLSRSRWLHGWKPWDPFCNTIDATNSQIGFIFQNKPIFQAINISVITACKYNKWIHSFCLQMFLLCAQIWVSFIVQMTAS